MDQTFDAVFEAHKEAKGRDACDMGFEGLADEGQHVLTFFEVVRFPFGFNGNAFPRAGLIGGHGVEGQGLLRFFFPQFAAALILANEAVDHEVRVAADWRRKVGIAIRGQAEVAGVGRSVPGLLHGAQGDGLNDGGFIGALVVSSSFWKSAGLTCSESGTGRLKLDRTVRIISSRSGSGISWIRYTDGLSLSRR